MQDQYEHLWSQCELQRSALEKRGRQVEALLDCSPAGILLVDHDGHVLRANQEFSRLLGIEDISLGGLPIRELIEVVSIRLQPPIAPHRLEEILAGQRGRREITLTLPTAKTLLVQRAGVTGEDGDSFGALVLLQDISEIVRMRQELEDLAQLPQVNPFAVVRLGADGHVSYANPACQTFLRELGVEADNLEPLLPPNYKDLLRKVLEERATLTDLKVESMGRILQITLAPFSIRDEVFLTMVDVSEKQRAEELLRKHAQELEEAYVKLHQSQAQLVQSEKMAMLGMLAAGITHELNTPAGAISSAIDTIELLRRKLSETLQAITPRIDPQEYGTFESKLRALHEMTGTVAMASDRISKIVRSLKSFVRLEEAPLKSVDLHEGLDSTLTLLDNQLKKRIEVIREYHPLPPVECLSSQINQVFMNILVNAIEAIPDRGVIRIRTEGDAGWVNISISDTGRGIPREKLESLFEPSFTRRGTRIGAGFGLSICQKIVHDHGGEIRAESTPGQGSTFIVHLPVRFASPAERLEAQSSTSPTQAG
jgi:PAS domain S-box-containing protein